MKIGVPKEIKNHEYRVGLTPASVHEPTSRGGAVGVAPAIRFDQAARTAKSGFRHPRRCAW